MAFPWAPVIMGVMGLLQGAKSRKAGDKALNSATGMNKFLEGIMRDLYSRGQAYDPSVETQTAVDYSAGVTQSMLERALRSLNAQHLAGGGVSGGDTLFNMKAQGITDRAADPLREFAAMMKSQEFARKNQALMAAFAAPTGQMSSTYFNIANARNQQFDPSGSMQLLMQGFGGNQSGGTRGGNASSGSYGAWGNMGRYAPQGWKT